MKRIPWKCSAALAALAFSLSMNPVAAAQCGLPGKAIKPSAWNPQLGAAAPRFVKAALTDFDDHEPSIVGMWHVLFTATTQNGMPIPIASGVVIDNAVAVWHPDGTEIMNSSRSAQDGNFCLGVWERTGPRSYLLNHIPWQGNVFDPTVPPDTIGSPQGGAQIIERVTLSPDGNSFTGTFTLQAYTPTGSVYTSFTGTISGKRITPETPFSALL